MLPAVCLLTATLFAGCGLMEDAFKAGVIITIIIVAVIGLLIWVLRNVAGSISKNYEVEVIPYRQPGNYPLKNKNTRKNLL